MLLLTLYHVTGRQPSNNNGRPKKRNGKRYMICSYPAPVLHLLLFISLPLWYSKKEDFPPKRKESDEGHKLSVGSVFDRALA
jgi:hypothetical protein